MCGVSKSPIGVDVEKVIENIMPIAHRFYTKKEYEYIKNGLVMEQNAKFCKIWTLKESYVKCIGKGLSVPLDSFGFFVVDDVVEMYKEGVLIQSYKFMSRTIDAKHYVAVCVWDDECEIYENNIQTISTIELLAWKDKYVDNIKELIMCKE